MWGAACASKSSIAAGNWYLSPNGDVILFQNHPHIRPCGAPSPKGEGFRNSYIQPTWLYINIYENIMGGIIMSVLTDLIYGGSNAVAGLTEGAVNDAIA